MTTKRKASGAPAVEHRVAELAALRQAPGRRPVGRFVAALRDPALAAAKTAAMGLCDRKAILGPLEELLADPDPNLRWRACALTWFFMIRDAVPLMLRALRDPDRMVRTEAAWSMRSAETDAAARALLRALKDRERIVAHYASWVLRRILRPRCGGLRSLRGVPIPELPLRPEPPGRRGPLARAIDDDAHGFEQFAAATDLPVCRAALGRPAPAGGGALQHIDGYPEAPLRKTDFRVWCSPDALHLEVRCAYASRAEVAARHRRHGQPVYLDNSVEVFLDPSGRGRPPYFQICLNPAGARWAARVFAAGHTWRPAGRAAEAPPWRPAGIRSRVRIEKGWWRAELSVPFADLGLRRGRVGKLWRMNVVRNGRLPELAETTSWCDMGDHDAHRPERFGWLWVDAGDAVNADGRIFQAEPLPLRPGLPGWRRLKGAPRVRQGELVAPPGGASMRWGEAIDFESFEVACQAMLRHQVRLMFAPDAANAELSWMAAYIHPINEINVAALHRWEHWAPDYPGHLSIFKEVYPRLTHSRWYDLAVRVTPRRVQTLLDGAVHMELPNPNPDVRCLGLALVGGGKVRKLRVRPLREETR